MNNRKMKNVADIHTHILPAIDDGAKDWEQSYEMLDIAYGQGIKTIIATPHYMPGSRKGKAQRIIAGVEVLQAYSDKQGYDISIFPGNEIYYHDEVPELLEEGEILTLAGSEYVLVEFSPMDDARYIRNALANIQSAGYTPVIAHVERYESLCKKPFDRIDELRQMGILIQVNASTIEGRMGRKIQGNVMKLLKLGLVDFIGTDAHSSGTRSPMVQKAVAILNKKLPKEYVDKILFANVQHTILNINE